MLLTKRIDIRINSTIINHYKNLGYNCKVGNIINIPIEHITWKDNPKYLNGFKEIQINDKIKNEYCRNNNIKLIRIPYTEIRNINNILKKELNFNETF